MAASEVVEVTGAARVSRRFFGFLIGPEGFQEIGRLLLGVAITKIIVY